MGEAFDKELIKKQYPYPIATYYAKMQKEELTDRARFEKALGILNDDH